jgi:hypothetical protein
VTVLPETPAPSKVKSGSSVIGKGDSWADYVIPNGDESTVLGDGIMAVAGDGLKLRHPVRPPVIHRWGLCGGGDLGGRGGFLGGGFEGG